MNYEQHNEGNHNYENDDAGETADPKFSRLLDFLLSQGDFGPLRSKSWRLTGFRDNAFI